MAIDRPVIVNDDGTNETGTVGDAAWVDDFCDRIDAAITTGIAATKLDDLATPDDNTDLNATTSRHGLLKKLDNDTTHFLRGDGAWATAGGPWTVATTSTSTGAQNNWAPGISGNTYVEWNGASDAAFTGIAGGVAGQFLTVRNITADKVATFAHNSGSSSAGNKLKNRATSAATPIANGGFVTYFYNGTDWMLVAHEQGAPVDYSGTSTIVGFSSFTTKHLRYILDGRKLRFFFALAGTSNATTTSFTLPFTATTAAADGSADFVNSFARDNGVTITQPTRSQFSDSVTVQAFTDMGTTGWTASNQKIVRGTSEVDID